VSINYYQTQLTNEQMMAVARSTGPAELASVASR